MTPTPGKRIGAATGEEATGRITRDSRGGRILPPTRNMRPRRKKRRFATHGQPRHARRFPTACTPAPRRQLARAPPLSVSRGRFGPAADRDAGAVARAVLRVRPERPRARRRGRHGSRIHPGEMVSSSHKPPPRTAAFSSAVPLDWVELGTQVIECASALVSARAAEARHHGVDHGAARGAPRQASETARGGPSPQGATDGSNGGGS